MSEPTSEDQPARPVRRLRVRKAPRYEVFIGSGAILGLVIAVVSGFSGSADPQTGRAKLIGYLAMTLALLGGLLGGAVAVGLERFYRRSRIDSAPRGSGGRGTSGDG